jgi:transposase-like protein
VLSYLQPIHHHLSPETGQLNMRDEVVPAPVQPAANCPQCRSIKTITTSKTSDATTYWRCLDCGEVWNAGRREAASKASRSSWGWR